MTQPLARDKIVLELWIMLTPQLRTEIVLIPTPGIH
jgi:hypothetical protein